MRCRTITAVLFLLILLAASIGPHSTAAAQADPPPSPILLKDINPAESEGSSPTHFMPAGPVTYFFAKQADSQYALFKTDGTSAGTALVKAGIRPGYYDSSAIYKDELYFPAKTTETGDELWRTNGAPGGIDLFMDLYPGPNGSWPTNLTAFQDRLYFTSYDGHFSSTDGTPAGTQVDWKLRVTSPMLEFHDSLYYSAEEVDSNDNVISSSLSWFGTGGSGSTTGLTPGSPLLVYKDRLYFTASRADVGAELFSTAGTSESVALLRDINPAGDAEISRLFVYDGLLYFTATDAAYGKRLWRSDGTEAGTLPVYAPPASTPYFDLVGAVQPAGEGQPGGLLLVTWDTIVLGNRQLWRTDGTPAGTQFLADLKFYEFDIPPDPGILFNNVYYFTGFDKAHGEELWHTDGTPAGTTRLLDLQPGPRGSQPGSFVPCGARLCFTADDGLHGQELWSTDGTAAGTLLAADINLDPADSYPVSFTPAGSLLYFAAHDSISETNLWRTDGTSAGTLALNLNPAVTIKSDYFSSGLRIRMAPAGNTLFFLADDPDHGIELWKSDGTPAGTGLVKDIWPGKFSSNPWMLRAAGKRLFLFATAPQVGEELWVSDGTPGGTRMVKDIIPGTSYGTDIPYGMAGFGDLVIFSIEHTDTSSCDLWRSDATPAGTFLIQEGLCISEGVQLDGKLYFTALGPGYGYSLFWETDGTQAGTKKVSLPPWGSNLDNFHALTLVNHDLYFLAADSNVSVLARISSNGTGGIIKNFYPINSVSNSLVYLVPLASQVAFTANMQDSEVEGQDKQLWFSDGSEAGTRRIQAGFTNPTGLMPVGPTLYFSATDPLNGEQLWRSDGTPSGTQRISAITQKRCRPLEYSLPGSAYLNDLWLAFHNGLFLLPLNDGSTGCELWTFDYLTHKARLPAIYR